MAAGQEYHPGDAYFAGTLTAKNNVPSAGSVGDTQVKSGDYVQAVKLIHQFCRSLDQAPGASVVAQTKIVHAVAGANTNQSICGVASLTAAVDAAATGDHTVTIDVQKRNGGGAWASILAAPYVINSATPAGTAEAISVAQPTLVTGDLVKIVVTVAGSTGVQAQGLIVELQIREYPQ